MTDQAANKVELATAAQVFSFAKSPWVKWRIAGACAAAVVSGSVFPGEFVGMIADERGEGKRAATTTSYTTHPL
jgi:hypothetical protein